MYAYVVSSIEKLPSESTFKRLKEAEKADHSKYAY